MLNSGTGSCVGGKKTAADLWRFGGRGEGGWWWFREADSLASGLGVSGMSWGGQGAVSTTLMVGFEAGDRGELAQGSRSSAAVAWDLGSPVRHACTASVACERCWGSPLGGIQVQRGQGAREVEAWKLETWNDSWLWELHHPWPLTDAVDSQPHVIPRIRCSPASGGIGD